MTDVVPTSTARRRHTTVAARVLWHETRLGLVVTTEDAQARFQVLAARPIAELERLAVEVEALAEARAIERRDARRHPTNGANQ